MMDVISVIVILDIIDGMNDNIAIAIVGCIVNFGVDSLFLLSSSSLAISAILKMFYYSFYYNIINIIYVYGKMKLKNES